MISMSLILKITIDLQAIHHFDYTALSTQNSIPTVVGVIVTLVIAAVLTVVVVVILLMIIRK